MKLVLELDEQDEAVIQKEFALRQLQRRLMPDGTTSNTPGAMVAEIVRDLIEYRALFDVYFPPNDKW